MDHYFTLIIKNKLYSNIRNLKYKIWFIFRDIDFKDKNVLEIGGGSGIFSLYCACSGAKKVTCLEPGFSGSTKNITKKFGYLKKTLNLNNITLIDKTFQNFKTKDKFDLVLLHNSINHLNENACINLNKEKNSQDIYDQIFIKINNICNYGAKLIILDCSPQNIFPSMGLKNLFSKSIEWHKHQTPNSWSALIKGCGFELKNITWSSPNVLGRIGNILLGNKFISFFWTSHFRIEFRKYQSLK